MTAAIPDLADLGTPLRRDDTGTIRVGGTRVTLDTVVSAYRNGFTAEEIAEQYPVVALSDVYGALAYFLRHREELDAYLAERAADAARLRADIEAALPPGSLRERLLARRHGQGE